MAELRKMFPEKRLVLADIGVHVGWYTLNAANRGYKVLAFEAFELNRRILKFEMCINEPSYGALIEQVHFGLSSQPTDCKLYSLKYNSQNGMISCTDEPRYNAVFRDFVRLEALDN